MSSVPQHGMHRPVQSVFAVAAATALIIGWILEPPDLSWAVYVVASLVTTLLSFLLVPVLLFFAFSMMLFRRLPRMGLPTGMLGLITKIVVFLVKGIARVLGAFFRFIARPRETTSFSVTDERGRRWQIRIFRAVPELRLHDQVQIRGFRISGIVIASAVHIPETGVTLRGSTFGPTVFTAFLVTFATATLVGALM